MRRKNQFAFHCLQLFQPWVFLEKELNQSGGNSIRTNGHGHLKRRPIHPSGFKWMDMHCVFTVPMPHPLAALPQRYWI
jgi:hypothetical protein